MNRAKLAPYIHSTETVYTMHFDLLAALLPLIIVSAVQNGPRVIVMCVLSGMSAWVVETLGNFAKLRFKPAPFRAAVLGICMTLLCPVTVPVWMPALGAAAAALFVRVVLIGNFKNLFMSPAIGWLFLLSFFPKEMMTYPVNRGLVFYPVFSDITDFSEGWGLARYLQFGEKPPYRMLDILFGRYPGGMGTTCVLLIFAITVYFLIRRSIAWQTSLSMMATVAVFAALFNRTDASLFYSVVYELSASSLIYVAIFIAGDLFNAPKLPSARIAFGVLLGAVTLFFRYFGLYEHAVAFALVFVNLISEALDKMALSVRLKIKSSM